MDNNNYNNYNNYDQMGGTQNPQQNGYINGYPMNYNNRANYNQRMGDGNVGGIQGAFSQARELFQQKVVAYSFLFMVVALGITAVGAYVGADVMFKMMFDNPGIMFILAIAEIATVIVANIALKKNNVVLSAALLTAYSFVNGATIGVICKYGYEMASVAQVFVITCVMFGITAFYGLVCKKDLSSVGGLCFMGLIGLIVAGIINMLFFRGENSTFSLIASVIGVAVFVGLTAYDTQKIKEKTAFADENNVLALSINGALELYLDFINLFLYLLRLFGKRR